MADIMINGKKYLYKPHVDEISLERLKQRLMSSKSFINIFRKNLTDGFINSMTEIVNPNIRHEENTIWNVMGLSGSGKSLCIISLAKLLTKERFSYKNVVFYDQQIIERVKDIERDSFLIRDETIASFGVGSQRVIADLTAISETARKYGVNLAFLSPSEKEISVAKWNLYTVDIDYKNRITRMGLQDPFTKKFLGAVYVRVLPENDEDWKMYNLAKDNFIQSIRDGKIGAKEDYKSIAKDILKKIDLEIFTKKKERIAFIRTELPNITNAEIDMVATFVEIIIKHGSEALTDEKEEEE